MVIKYFGHSFLLLEGNDYSICLDPFCDVGLNIPNISSNYVFSSHNHFDHNNIKIVKNAKLVKESDCFKIIPTYHDNKKGALRGKNNVLLFKLDGVKIAFMGDFGENNNEEVITILKNVDILFIPIGGKYTIDSKTAYNYINEIKPKLAIPIHYKIEGSNIDIADEKEFLSYFNNYQIKNTPYTYDNESGVVVLSVVKES